MKIMLDRHDLDITVLESKNINIHKKMVNLKLDFDRIQTHSVETKINMDAITEEVQTLKSRKQFTMQ